MDKFIADLRKEILSSEARKDHLHDAHNDMVRSLVIKDKSLAFSAINKHFDLIDEELDKMIKTI